MLIEIEGLVERLKEKAKNQEKQVLKEYEKAIKMSKFTLARLISDELLDYSETNSTKDRTKLYKELYNYTMLLYELNT